MSKMVDKPERYGQFSDDRKAHVDAILKCPSAKITVVAGPGTGKTYLFRSVLSNRERCLTLTFVNALVEDLSLELCRLSKVKTLHGYARSILGNNVKIFPRLSQLIRQDAAILLGTDIDFNDIFHNRDDDNEYIEFYKSRKSYYENYYGYSSIIYAAVKLFEIKKNKIPVYDQILVDEFQDFNKLEVSLIDLLAEKSPILLAADDDQALYAFKGASPQYIRHRHNKLNTEYASFTLPYCSRCSRVIVDSVNDILTKAKENGHLQDRIDKKFIYFEEQEKDADSNRFPKIDFFQVYARKIPWFIEQRLNDIAGEQQGLFSSLIIAPTTTQCNSIIASLKKKGLRAVESVVSKEGKEVTLLDGLSLLSQNKSSNLGWRIVAQHLLSKPSFKKLLIQTASDSPPAISNIIDRKTKSTAKKLVSILRKVKKGNQVNEDELDLVLDASDLNGKKIKADAVLEKLAISSPRVGNPGLRKVPIKVTTIQSSKGLDADFVFITYFDDRYFIKDRDKSKISDQDICNFIVSLTRAKKKVFLISSNKESEPLFLSWIDHIRINKNL